MQTEIRQVQQWGNSGGILLPREWLGKQVKITLIDRTPEIKKESLAILGPYLEDVIAIFLVGSYARGDQEVDSDIDMVAISKNTRKFISSGKYNIEIYPLQVVMNALKADPIMIYPRLKEARPILNSSLLQDLLSAKITINSFKKFLDACKRIIKINRGFVKLDEGEEYTDAKGIVYSLILRLRGIYMVKMILEEKVYSKQAFKRWVNKESSLDKEEIEKIYSIYKKEKNDKKINDKIPIKSAEKLIHLLEKEVAFYDKKRKKA